MTTIVSATRPAELLSSIPALAGFTPRRSLVLVPFAGKRSTGLLRVDLPHSGVDEVEFVARLIGLVCQVRDADRVAIVVYDDEPSDAGEPPWADLVDGLCERADACGLGIVEALYVGPESWAAYLREPWLRHPISEIPAPPAVPGIGMVEGDQHEGGELPAVDGEEAAHVAEALSTLRGVLEDRLAGRPERRTDPQALAARAVLDDVPAFFERMLESPATPAPYDAAALAWCLNTPLLRDVALVQWARNQRQGALALGAQLAFRERSEPVPDSLGSVLIGGGRRPDADRLGVALALVRTVAALAPEPDRAGPLVAAAWLAWALGRSTHAAAHIAQAREIDPDLSMAALIEVMLDHGVLPGWAFRAGG